MASLRWTLTVVLAIALQTAPVLAQSGGAPSTVGSKSRTVKTVKTVRSMITGTVIDQDGVPMPDSRVKLRNLQTKEIEQVSSTNHAGAFQFAAQPEIPYVVELADHDGRIIAVSEVIVTRTGDVAGTVLIAPSRPPAMARLFGDTASGVLAAVAGLGITSSVGPDAQPVSPEK